MRMVSAMSGMGKASDASQRPRLPQLSLAAPPLRPPLLLLLLLLRPAPPRDADVRDDDRLGLVFADVLGSSSSPQSAPQSEQKHPPSPDVQRRYAVRGGGGGGGGVDVSMDMTIGCCDACVCARVENNTPLSWPFAGTDSVRRTPLLEECADPAPSCPKSLGKVEARGQGA